MDELRELIGAIKGLLVAVLGSWKPPRWAFGGARWAQAGARWANAHRMTAGALVAASVAVGWGGFLLHEWWQKRPKPAVVAYSVEAPAATPLREDAEPDSLEVHFDSAVAPLSMIGKVVTEGVRLAPSHPGRWRWKSDRRLLFEPKEDWPVGAVMEVALAREALLTEGTLLEEYTATFETAAFEARLRESEFYQDPVRPDNKKVVATFAFSHPVDPQSLEKNLTLRFVPTDKQRPERELAFRVTYDELKGQAFVHSDPVRIPQKDAQVRIKLAPGTKSLRGGPSFDGAVGGEVRIPGLYNFLRVTALETRVVENARLEPEQVIIVRTSVGVTEKALATSVRAWLLPKYHPEDDKQRSPYRWGDPQQVSAHVLKASQKVKIDPLPASKEYDTLHSYRYDAPAERYLYVRVRKGVTGYGGYVLGETYQRTAAVPQFPPEVRILHEGALLSLSGERRLSVMARDVPALKFEVARFLPSQLHHLALQAGGDFATPRFWNSIDPKHLADFHEEVRPLVGARRGKPVYEALELSDLVLVKGRNRGLFLVEVTAWDKARDRSLHKSDRRLVLVTDLGLIVKRGLDDSRTVFVQSIAGGTPVSGAQVDVLGQNGLSVASARTGAQGRAELPPLGSLRREKQPSLFLVRYGTDWSFLPYRGSDRILDLSRFDVGGVFESAEREGLSAYLFSDRGVYRPGERAKIGLIVKRRDWGPVPDGLPLVAMVLDPRAQRIKRVPIKLDAAAFAEMEVPTQESSPTGTYDVDLYTVDDEEGERQIGHTTITVRDFLPDRLRIHLAFNRSAREGWVRPEELKARVSLQNLYGTPATARRVRLRLILAPGMPALRGYPGFSFFDPHRAKNGAEELLPELATGDDGEAEFLLDLERFQRATYRLTAVAEGFEAQGGRSVVAKASAVVSPLTRMVGYKADGTLRYIDRGAPRKVELIAVGPEGDRAAAADLKLETLQRKRVSVLTRQPNGTYKYQSETKEEALGQAKLEIPPAGRTVALKTDDPGDFAIVIRDSEGIELQRIDYSVAGEANVARSLERDAELKLKLKSESVASGGLLELEIRAPYAGAGLITVERDRVYSHQWFRTSTATSVQRIQVPAELEIGGYLSVALVRSPDAREVLTSPLSYGVIPFTISRDRRTIALSLDSEELSKPGQPYQIAVRADKPGRAVVFAVDEGILQVANYQSPDPLDHFLKKRPLGVRTAQLLDLIRPEHEQLLQSMAAGGGEEQAVPGVNLNPFGRRKERPVVFWSGLIDIGTEATELTYRVPDHFNGTLRIMAVAASTEAAGAASKSAILRSDFVITPMVPTFVAPGDRFEVPVTVANNVEGEEEMRRVAVSLESSEHFHVVGESAQNVEIGRMREKTTRFELIAKDHLGPGELTVSAKGGGYHAKRQVSVGVRPASPYLTTLEAGYLPAGEDKEVKVARRLYPHYRKLAAGISVIPLILAQGLTRYLEEFPHGCTEQLVSQVVPAVVLGKRPAFGFEPEKARRSVSRFIDTLWSRQNGEGGFGKWVANPKTAPLASIYAVHMLIEARERGFSVPASLLRQGMAYLHAVAKNTPDGLYEARLRAWAIYLITRSEVVTTAYALAAQRHLAANYPKRWRSDLAGAFLAATYALLQKRELAEEIMAAHELGEDHVPDYVHYYDSLVHDGYLLYLLARHFPSRLREVDHERLRLLVEAISQGAYNTFSSGAAILGLEAYAAHGAAAEASERTISERVGKSSRPLALPKSLLPVVAFSPGAWALQFNNGADSGSYYLLSQQGFDRKPPVKALARRVEVFREYLDDGGEVVEAAQVGDELQVRIRARATEAPLTDMAIVDLLPGGFEVVIQSGQSGGESWAQGLPISTAGTDFGGRLEYVDGREDRIVIYGSVGERTATFVYAIKAGSVGTFAVPPIQATSMYDPRVAGRGSAGTLTVRPR